MSLAHPHIEEQLQQAIEALRANDLTGARL
jgi:hypothetical protein